MEEENESNHTGSSQKSGEGVTLLKKRRMEDRLEDTEEEDNEIAVAEEQKPEKRSLSKERKVRHQKKYSTRKNKEGREKGKNHK